MTDTREPMDDLDQLLGSVARAPVPELSPTLEARLLHDADRLMPAAAGPVPAPADGWGAVLRGLGGWRALGGLATATAAGVWIGFAAPGALDGLTSDAVMVSLYQDMTLSEVDG